MSLLAILPFAMFNMETTEAQDQAGLLAYAIENADMEYLDLVLHTQVYIEPRFAAIAQKTGDRSVISRIRRHLFSQAMNAPLRLV